MNNEGTEMEKVTVTVNQYPRLTQNILLECYFIKNRSHDGLGLRDTTNLDSSSFLCSIPRQMGVQFHQLTHLQLESDGCYTNGK